MTSFIGGTLGGSKSKSTATYGQTLPINIRGSGGAFADIGGGSGMVRAAPNAAANRTEIRSLIRGLIGDVGNDITTLRGLENPFVNARVRPLENRLSEARSGLHRGLSRRGVQGTLANNELFRFDSQAGREIGDARTLALADALQSIFQRQNFQGSLAGQLRGLTEDEVAQSLAELGLGTQSVSNLVRQVRSDTRNEDFGEGLNTVASVVGSFFMSDRRLKSDITRIGTLDNGLAVYKYKMDGKYQIGVMADEVEKVNPEAVAEIGGYKAVNYGAL